MYVPRMQKTPGDRSQFSRRAPILIGQFKELTVSVGIVYGLTMAELHAVVFVNRDDFNL